MKLVVPCFGEVGIGSVVDVHPSRQWLGVTIPAFSTEFILVRPSTIVVNAETLILEPCQRGCTALIDALNRIVQCLSRILDWTGSPLARRCGCASSIQQSVLL